MATRDQKHESGHSHPTRITESASQILRKTRKNWLFCASEGGGERAAAFFTLLVSARLHEVEPWAWLRDVFDRMARLRAAGDDGDDSLRPLLPQNWLAEHPDKRVPYGR